MAKKAKVQFTIRLHPDTIAGIDKQCERAHVSRANYIQITMAKHLEQLGDLPDRTKPDLIPYVSTKK